MRPGGTKEPTGARMEPLQSLLLVQLSILTASSLDSPFAGARDKPFL